LKIARLLNSHIPAQGRDHEHVTTSIRAGVVLVEIDETGANEISLTSKAVRRRDSRRLTKPSLSKA